MKVYLFKTIRLIGLTLGIAIAYCISAILTQLLHTPPVYATAVWPPAGIALGAALVWGKRTWLGIFLGGLCGNAFTIIMLHGSASLSGILFPAAGIAVGAVLQAGTVAYLIRRWAGFPSQFNEAKNIVRFLSLVGPLGCCLNASFGNGLLIVADKVPLAELPVNWVTWWVGDTIGALIFTPLTLIAFGRPRAIWSPRWFTVALPLIICFAIATAIFARVRIADINLSQTEFSNLASAANRSIESSLQDFTVMIYALKGLYDASDNVNCTEFKTFTDILLTHRSELQAFEWAKRVSQSERKHFEEGHSFCDSDFSPIFERNAKGLAIQAGERGDYLPVTFINPMASNRPALGFDLLSERSRRETVFKARDSGNLTMTPPINLVQNLSGALSVLMVAPLYRPVDDMASLEDKREHFVGTVVGVLKIESLINTALAKLGVQKNLLHFRIKDQSLEGNEALLFVENAFSSDSSLLHHQKLPIGGRVWEISISGDERDFGHGLFSWYVLAGGMFFSGLVGGFLLLLTGKSMSMESVIEKRTSDLAASNQRLREEIDERNKTEKALRVSESKFRTLANAAPVLIWLAGIDKLCYWFNQVWLDFTGRTVEQEMGYGWAEGVHPDDFQYCVDCYVSHFDRREPFRMEYRLRRHDGEYRWLVDSGSPLVDGDGQFVGYIGSSIDVTERKLIEQETARLALVAEKTTTSIVITDAKGFIEWVNPAFTELSGYTFNEVIGRKPGTILQGPGTDSKVLEKIRESIAQQLGFDVELVNYKKNGTAYWVQLKVDPVIDQQGRLTQFIAVETDISERKANEKAIQQLNRSYQDLLTAASEVSIIATDGFGIITLFNRGAERMLGYTSDEVVGRMTPVSFHLVSEIEVRERELNEELGEPVAGFQVLTAIPDRRGQEMREWTYVSKDGLCIWVSLVVTQIKSEGGEATGYLGIAQNITERKAAETALQLAKQSADKANQAKSEFLANMSHEIRTPMNGVLGMIELLRGTPLSSEQQELADTACHSANALMVIINDILDISKIEAGKLSLDYVEFNVGELCESICSMLAISAQEKGLEFNCFVQPDMHTEVRGDPTRLRQVLVNLIGNAIKFTLLGEVSLEARCDAEDEKDIFLRFAVKDTGIGIRAEEVNRLFMPFEQAEHGTTRLFGGTGLGLSISKSLVELMGGEIEVISIPRMGSTFQFTLKLEKVSMANPRPQPFSLGGHRALIADDNKTNLEILNIFLKSWGVDVAAYDNGMQALAMLKAAHAQGEPFDVAILDQAMPELDGSGVIRALADIPEIQTTPCILLCSSGAVTELNTVKSRRVVCLGKPVRQSQLFDAMASLMDVGLVVNPLNQSKNTNALPQFPGKRLLLVEDNLVNQRVALKMLERFGLTARVASNGAEALQELQQNEFDLVFMDCQIPIMDGYSVTQIQRDREKNSGLARTPIVALTANAIQGDFDKSLSAGMDDHLTKPLSLKSLEKVLKRWLAESTIDNKQDLNENLEVKMSEPVWDYDSTLEAAGGDLELLKELQVLFISEAIRLSAELGTADAPQSAKAIASAAHSMKGMAGHFHAKTLVSLSAEVEKKAKADNMDSADPQIVLLKQEISRVIESMRTEG